MHGQEFNGVREMDMERDTHALRWFTSVDALALGRASVEMSKARGKKG